MRNYHENFQEVKNWENKGTNLVNWKKIKGNNYKKQGNMKN